MLPRIKTLPALLALSALIALPQILPAQTSTNSDVSSDLWSIATTGSNYFGIPFMTKSQHSRDFGGGFALGYRATEALAPVARIDEYAGKAYMCNLSLQLNVPRRLMGKVPIIPFGTVGGGFQLSTATVGNNFTISAGDPIAILGAGLYMPFDWIHDDWFCKRSLLAFDYEHWSGVNFPKEQQDQFRFGLGIKF